MTLKITKAADRRSCQRGPRPDLAIRNKARAVHGLNGSPTWKSWSAMIQRCTNQRCKDFANYGARDISVCDAWRDFSSFVSDMGLRPDGSTLGRINNDLGYSPANCRWESPQEQASNRRSSKFLEVGGRRQTIAAWSREIGCSRQALRWRLSQGWSPESAINTAFSHANRWR